MSALRLITLVAVGCGSSFGDTKNDVAGQNRSTLLYPPVVNCRVGTYYVITGDGLFPECAA